MGKRKETRRPGRPSKRKHQQPDAQRSDSVRGEKSTTPEMPQNRPQDFPEEEAAYVFQTEFSLARRFTREKIEVDLWDTLPFDAFLSSCDGRKRIMIRMTGEVAIPENYIAQWTDMQYGRKAAVMEAVLDEISEAAKLLSYDSRKMSWSLEKNEMDDGGSGERPAESDLRLLTYRLKTRLVSALIHGMADAKGRRFMESLLDVASLVCFGFNYFKNVEVMSMGTSDSEGFPIKPTESNQESQNGSDTNPGPFCASGLSKQNRHQPHRSSNSCDSSPNTDISASDASSDAGCDAGSVGNANKKYSSGYLRPDCIVASRRKPDFARYLLVAEVSSSLRLSDAELAQLYRNMIGAGMHQTEVFGVIINSVEARIVRMMFNDTRDTMQFCTHTSYVFGSSGDSTPALVKEKFCRFFRDVVAVLDYSNVCVSEVKHPVRN